MDQNRDWKPIVALALAALALLVAFGGPRGGRGNEQAGAVPQQIIVQTAPPSTGATGVGAVAPVVAVPVAQPGVAHAWGGWGGGGGGFNPIFPLLFFAGLIFLAFKFFGPNRRGWGGPGPQAPTYTQYPPQQQQASHEQAQAQNQPYSGYAQGQGQPTQAINTQGDITRPEGDRY